MHISQKWRKACLVRGSSPAIKYSAHHYSGDLSIITADLVGETFKMHETGAKMNENLPCQLLDETWDILQQTGGLRDREDRRQGLDVQARTCIVCEEVRRWREIWT